MFNTLGIAVTVCTLLVSIGKMVSTYYIVYILICALVVVTTLELMDYCKSPNRKVTSSIPLSPTKRLGRELGTKLRKESSCDKDGSRFRRFSSKNEERTYMNMHGVAFGSSVLSRSAMQIAKDLSTPMESAETVKVTEPVNVRNNIQTTDGQQECSSSVNIPKLNKNTRGRKEGRVYVIGTAV